MPVLLETLHREMPMPTAALALHSLPLLLPVKVTLKLMIEVKDEARLSLFR
jgi:hypothetical protein